MQSNSSKPQKSLSFPALHDSRYPIHKVANWIEPYLQAIVARVQPEKIILFGSYAYGTPTQHSDFDLLVLRRGISSSKESNIELRFVIWDVNAAPASFTFLSQTPEGFQEKLRSGSFVYKEISEKGLELYAAEEDK
jgi:UTP:GlnB (protein PII) uridylyltransferase